MRDFVNWCVDGDLVDIANDGTVTWKEAAVRGPQKGSHKEKFDGGRDGRKDLSDDYKDYCHMMGTVWPYKVVAKGKGGKAVAPVGK
jgi:hypothetical protein